MYVCFFASITHHPAMLHKYMYICMYMCMYIYDGRCVCLCIHRSVDMWGMGCLLWELFSGSLTQVSALRNTSKVSHATSRLKRMIIKSKLCYNLLIFHPLLPYVPAAQVSGGSLYGVCERQPSVSPQPLLPSLPPPRARRVPGHTPYLHSPQNRGTTGQYSGCHFPSILLGWMELGPTFPAFCWDGWNWVPLSQHFAGMDGTGFQFSSIVLGWMELGSNFPALCWDGWNWVPLSQHFAGMDGTRSHFPSILPDRTELGATSPSILLGWMELGLTFPSIVLGWMELGPTFPSILLGWMELDPTFPSILLGMELGPTFPFCWDGWNWVPLFPAFCWGGWNWVPLFPAFFWGE